MNIFEQIAKELNIKVGQEKLKRICAYEDAKYVLQIPESILYAGLSLLLVCGGCRARALVFAGAALALQAVVMTQVVEDRGIRHAARQRQGDAVLRDLDEFPGRRPPS